MPDSAGLSLVGCKSVAGLVKTALANAKVRLFKDAFSPTPANVLADFVAQECDFDGYVLVTVVAWANPVLASSQAGYLLTGGLVSFAWVLDTLAVGNQVGGYWVETAGGVLMQYVKFGTSVPVQGPDQVVEFVPVYIQGTGT